MNCEDQTFLENLGGPIGHGPKWKVFSRRRRVLLVLPASRGGMTAGARMYQPQRKIARLASWCFLKLPLLWRLLPTIRWEPASDSPLGMILENSQLQAGAILLGNPVQVGRRALMMSRGPQASVIKIGVEEPALGLVKSEREFIESNADECPEMSPLDFQGDGENWTAFGVRFLEGGEVSIPSLCEILQGWSENALVPFEELKSASLLKASDHPHAGKVWEQCRELKLRRTLVHGDLAPWNVRQGASGSPVMIDWEEGRQGDVPCWDLVHFVFQKAVLVDRLDPQGTVELIMEILNATPARALLEQSGWGKNVNLLLASYLIAMATEDSHATEIMENLDYNRIA